MRRCLVSCFSLCVAVVKSLFEILFDTVGSAVEVFELFIILLEILFDIVSFVSLLHVSLQLKTIRSSILHPIVHFTSENRLTILFHPIILFLSVQLISSDHLISSITSVHLNFVRPSYFILFPCPI